jgi:hypothetical protein
MAEQQTDKRQPPRFSGVIVHKDRLGRFSIRHATDWDAFVFDGTDEGGQDGILFRPNPDDLQTFFNVWVRELEQGIVAEDLEDLREGMQEGLKQLPGIEIERFTEVVLDNLIKFEIVYSFCEGEATLKRLTWVLYADRWQFMLTWQGSSPAEYDYWLAMANYSFATFELPQALMFATDREMVKRFAKELGREAPSEGEGEVEAGPET